MLKCVKKYWSIFAAAIIAIVGFIFFRRRSSELFLRQTFSKLREIEIEKIKEAAAEERRRSDENDRNVKLELEKIKNEKDAAIKNLEESKKNKVDELTKLGEENPRELASELSKLTGFKVIE